MATITSLRSSSARRTSHRHSSESSASGEARNSSASQATFAFTSVSRQRSPACTSCRSMKTSPAAKPAAIDELAKAADPFIKPGKSW
jgi:hypothetical protein